MLDMRIGRERDINSTKQLWCKQMRLANSQIDGVILNLDYLPRGKYSG